MGKFLPRILSTLPPLLWSNPQFCQSPCFLSSSYLGPPTPSRMSLSQPLCPPGNFWKLVFALDSGTRHSQRSSNVCTCPPQPHCWGFSSPLVDQSFPLVSPATTSGHHAHRPHGDLTASPGIPCPPPTCDSLRLPPGPPLSSRPSLLNASTWDVQQPSVSG